MIGGVAVGFREPESTITIRFKEGHRYHGLEATAISLTIDEYATGFGWYDSDSWGDGETIDRFHKSLVSWNLTDGNDRPIPVSESRSRDQHLIRALNKAWIQMMVSGVHDADPLSDSSASGVIYPELSAIPTEPLSESRAS